MELKRVVVTGIGAVTPIGNTAEETWHSMLAGVSGAAPITHFNAEKFKTQFACEVKGFDATKYIDRKEARKMDLYTQYAIVAAKQAIEDSAMDLDKVDKNKIGVIYGVGIGGLRTFEEEYGYYERTKENGPKFNPFFIPKMISDISVGHISIMFGLRGPNFVTTSACASSTNALIDAFNYIRLGKADAIIAGGAEAAITVGGVAGFSAMRAISTRNDDPQGASRPFSKSRDGFVLGEGGAALILEEYEHAVARGAKIYCEVAGAGMSADAHHMTAPHPEGEGAILSMEEALRDAELSASDIDYINVHGTSTPLGDIAELKALDKIFGESIKELSISSTKSMTGHLLGGAGAVEALAVVMAITKSVIPPTINIQELDPAIDERINLTRDVAQQREVRYALSNTFGFGGHNACVIFKKYVE